EANHPDIASTLNDLGTLYFMQGKYPQSEPLLRQALAIREQVLGSEHPDTATSFHNLAELYRKQGKYSNAEDFYQRAFQIRQRVFGPDHPVRAQRSEEHTSELQSQ